MGTFSGETARPMRVLVLDDYESRIKSLADWGSLADRAQFSFMSRRIASNDELVSALQGFDGVVLTRERTAFPASVIRGLPQLKLIITMGKGNASLDVPAATEAGILVCGTVTFGHPTAELVWGLVIALLRRTPQASRMLQDGIWMPLIGEPLKGKTLGILGLGRIGSRVARVGLAFEMNVIAWSQNLTPQRADEVGVDHVGKEELFGRSDVLSIHVGLSDRYRGFVGKEEFSLMKPSAVLVNTSRAAIVDEAALLSALREHRIAGAGLDVFHQEPLSQDSEILRLDNVVATPHLGFATSDNLADSYGQAIECVDAFLRGQPVRPINTVHVKSR